jgi:4-hydroxybenzoate polyprenyltransferase
MSDDRRVTEQPELEHIVQLLAGLVRTMRPRQWIKNVLIYAGIVFDGQLFIPESFLRITIGFILLSAVAGSVYIINDLADVASDRQHPKKRSRPIASGQFPIRAAIISAIAIPLISSGLALLIIGPLFTVVLLAYFVLQIAYSLRLKHIVILDVMSVMIGFILRVLAGIAAVPVAEFSPWLYAITGLLALFLIVGKRRQELLTLAEKAGTIRVTLEHYNLPMLDDMLRMVMTGTIIAYLLYAIEAPSALLAGTDLALLTVPFVIYGMFRYLFLIHVRGEGSAPEEVLLRDRPLQVAILLWGATFIIILYLVPLMR